MGVFRVWESWSVLAEDLIHRTRQARGGLSGWLAYSRYYAEQYWEVPFNVSLDSLDEPGSAESFLLILGRSLCCLLGRFDAGFTNLAGTIVV